jgi:hypothetical protein
MKMTKEHLEYILTYCARIPENIKSPPQLDPCLREHSILSNKRTTKTTNTGYWILELPDREVLSGYIKQMVKWDDIYH